MMKIFQFLEHSSRLHPKRQNIYRNLLDQKTAHFEVTPRKITEKKWQSPNYLEKMIGIKGGKEKGHEQGYDMLSSVK